MAGWAFEVAGRESGWVGEWISWLLWCPGFGRSAYKAGGKDTDPLVPGGGVGLARIGSMAWNARWRAGVIQVIWLHGPGWGQWLETVRIGWSDVRSFPIASARRRRLGLKLSGSVNTQVLIQVASARKGPVVWNCYFGLVVISVNRWHRPGWAARLETFLFPSLL